MIPQEKTWPVNFPFAPQLAFLVLHHTPLAAPGMSVVVELYPGERQGAPLRTGSRNKPSTLVGEKCPLSPTLGLGHLLMAV